MRSWIFMLFLISGLPVLVPAQTWENQPGWARFFTDAGVKGTIVVVDERSKKNWVFDEDRVQRRFIPASTFKIPHLLFALDAGLVHDEFQVFPWDGVKRNNESWNQDQDVRSSMRRSVVWVYQLFAQQLGDQREQEYLQRIGYGNTDVSGGVDRFWLDGGLRISAHEQIEFLQRLYRNTLPFEEAHQRLVKDIIIVEAGRDWILRAKTGWGEEVNKQIGWWVGWVEWPEGAVFFALNINMPNEGNDTPKRESIARQVLRSIHALPTD